MTDALATVSAALRAAHEHLRTLEARRSHHHQLAADELTRRLAARPLPLEPPPPTTEGKPQP